MSLDLDPIADLDVAEVAAARAIVAAKVVEAVPDADARRGVYRDRVVEPAAVLAALLGRKVARTLAAANLVDVEADPALADRGTVDRLLSNFRVARRPASVGTGDVVIVVTDPAPITLPFGTAMAAGQTALRSTATVTVRIPGSRPAADSDRPLTPVPGGGYAFSVPATAVDPGPAGALRRGAVVTVAAPPPGFAKAYVADDWTGGLAEQTAAELFDAMRAGLATPTWGSRASIDSLLRTVVPGLVATSVVGPGDPEAVRGAPGPFPIAADPRCDVWLLPAGPPARVAVTAPAVLLDRDDSGVGIWEAMIPADAAPGFLWVDSVGPAGGDPSAAGFVVTAVVRSVDPAAAADAPAVATAADAAYSRFQTAAVRFSDPGTPAGAPTDGSVRRDVVVTVAARRGLVEAQALLSSREAGPVVGDALARAAVPGRVRVEVEILARGPVAPGPGAAAAVASAIEGGGFGAIVTASGIAAAVAPFLPRGAAVGAVLMGCEVLAPTGATIRLRSRSALRPPDDPAAAATARTVAFTADAADVTFSTTRLDGGGA